MSINPGSLQLRTRYSLSWETNTIIQSQLPLSESPAQIPTPGKQFYYLICCTLSQLPQQTSNNGQTVILYYLELGI